MPGNFRTCVFIAAQLSPPSLLFTNITSTMATITIAPPPSLSAITPDNYIISLWRAGGIPGGCLGDEANRTIPVSPEQMRVQLTNLEEVK